MGTATLEDQLAYIYIYLKKNWNIPKFHKLFGNHKSHFTNDHDGMSLTKKFSSMFNKLISKFKQKSNIVRVSFSLTNGIVQTKMGNNNQGINIIYFNLFPITVTTFHHLVMASEG